MIIVHQSCSKQQTWKFLNFHPNTIGLVLQTGRLKLHFNNYLHTIKQEDNLNKCSHQSKQEIGTSKLHKIKKGMLKINVNEMIVHILVHNWILQECKYVLILTFKAITGQKIRKCVTYIQWYLLHYYTNFLHFLSI